MSYSIHTVAQGDTLSKIAKTYDMDLASLLHINPQIEDSNLIFIGQSVNVALSDESADTSTPTLELTGPAWYQKAQQELEAGVRENTSRRRHNPRIIQYHSTTTLQATDDETPWCSSFVNWCFTECGLTGTNSAAARSWLRWGETLSEPQVGCVVVFRRGTSPTSGHVGFYHGRQGSHILVLGGNQANEVNISSYSERDLLGFRWVLDNR